MFNFLPECTYSLWFYQRHLQKTGILINSVSYDYHGERDNLKYL
jgi:hypothetical protein